MKKAIFLFLAVSGIQASAVAATMPDFYIQEKGGQILQSYLEEQHIILVSDSLVITPYSLAREMVNGLIGLFTGGLPGGVDGFQGIYEAFVDDVRREGTASFMICDNAACPQYAQSSLASDHDSLTGLYVILTSIMIP